MYSSRDFLESLEERTEIDPYVVQHATRFARTVQEINRLFADRTSRPSIRVLDCGSHTGALTIALKAEGYDVCGVDLEEVVPEYKDRYERNGIDFKSMTDPTKLPYDDGDFDCVVFAETLEHIYNSPLLILNELKRILKPGGFLVLTTPNVMRLENKLKFLFNVNIYQDLYRYVHSPRLSLHYHEYTKRELVTLLQDYVRMPVVRAIMFDSPAGRTPFRRLLQSVLYMGNRLIPGFKVVLLAVARKPES